MIASLPMYARPELAGPIKRYWDAIHDHAFVQHVTFDQTIIGIEAWRRPDLFLSQTCGAPYRDHLANHVQLVGTPNARLPACPPGYYQSVLIARDSITWAEAIRLPWTANEAGSQSGNYAPRMRAPAPLDEPIWSGSHLSSIDIVAKGQADWAAIDAVTWEIGLRLGQGFGLVVWDRTEPTPALPYVTNLTNDPHSIAAAVSNAIAYLAPSDRDALCLYDLIQIPRDAYFAVPKP
ncbi:MAG: PhnD/SsuA/transferrin family substrate-binding protein [Pseudomonadota bacterium]